MNNSSSMASNPLIIGIGGFVIGLILGWLVLSAITLSPLVKIVDLDPTDLKQVYKSAVDCR